jgi:glycosyltransferase involved in cell wall biosynthesis
LPFDGTVFVTQVIEWLHLYASKGFKFDLYVMLSITQIFDKSYLKYQKSSINKYTRLFQSFIFLFPSRGFYLYLNSIFFITKTFFWLLKYDNVVIMSRATIGTEVKILKTIFPNKINFVLDCRASGGEEKFYLIKKNGLYDKPSFNILGHIFKIEMINYNTADRILVVSNKLKEYIIQNFRIKDEKFQFYPCLSDRKKFFYSEQLRNHFRKEMGYLADDIVILYAGGLSAKWHVSRFILDFYSYLHLLSNRFKFMFLSADVDDLNSLLSNYPMLKECCVCRYVSNSEVVNYLNVADFGTLFREDTIMNNVASPTKFAEYMLAGLPTLISPGVGDYSRFVEDKKVGIVVDIKNFNNVNFNDLLYFKFDRNQIAVDAISIFDKGFLLDDMCKLFKEFKE